MVVLDIGGDIGALVVTTPASLAGVEIEICPAGARTQPADDGADWWSGDWHAHGHSHAHGRAWPHVAVMSRPTSEGRPQQRSSPGCGPVSTRSGCDRLNPPR